MNEFQVLPLKPKKSSTMIILISIADTNVDLRIVDNHIYLYRYPESPSEADSALKAIQFADV